MNIRIGRISNLLTPGLGACHKCKTTWRFVKKHTTQIDSKSGIFPLCEKCWAELTPETRLPYYRLLMRNWKKIDGYVVPAEERAAIITAVLAGK